MRTTLLCCIAVIAATPAGAVNWPQPGLTAGHIGLNKAETVLGAGNVGSLKQRWSLPIASGIQGAPPLELNGIVYVQGGDGTDYAVGSRSGKVLWSFAGGFSLGLTLGDNRVFTSCNLDANRHAGICALDAATGAVVWKTAVPDCGGGVAPFSSAPNNVPVYDRGMVFFAAGFGGFNSACSGDTVFGVNAATGATVWAVAENLVDKSDGLPFAIDKDRVFYTTGGATAYICSVAEASGSGNVCSAPLSGSFADSATLSVSGGKVFSVYQDNSGNTIFTAFSEATLAVAWSHFATGGTSNYSRFAPTIANGLAYFFAGSNGLGSLYAFSAKTGAAVWTYACDSSTTGCVSSGVSAANGVLYAACGRQTTAQGDLCAFDAKTGAVLRVYGPLHGNSGSTSTPLVANGAEIAACGDSSGDLCKFAP